MIKTHPKEIIEQNMLKLKPLKYNQFFWWRKWDLINKPLHKDDPLWDKIRNGDFDFSHYFWQLQHCEMELNEIYKKGDDAAIHVERRKRLRDDFVKDETARLNAIKQAFINEFIMGDMDYDEAVDKCTGTLEDLYNYCKLNFYKRIHVQLGRKRGRPKK